MAKTDAKTLQLIAQVKAQKATIASLSKPNWRTNCSFSYSEGRQNDAINLHTVTDLKTLVSIAAFLRQRDMLYGETAKMLEVVDPPAFSWGGYLLSDWLEDLRVRIAKVQVTARKSRLELLEAKLNAILSPEQKAELELEAIEKELGS